MKKYLFIIVCLLIVSCASEFDELNDFSETRFELVDQNNQRIIFPNDFKDKTVVMNFIFTNCPDICPLSTNNLRLVQESLTKEKVKGVQFLSISFDPDFDKPEVLKKFAEIRKLNLDNWAFLTGEKSIIDSLMRKAEIVAIPSDSRIFADGRKIYFYVHTDRIIIMDRDGKIRKQYPGSSIDPEIVAKDVISIN
jgi:protein SCO1/2